MARLPMWALRLCAVLAIVLCSSCFGPRHGGHGAQPPQPTSAKPLGRTGCGAADQLSGVSAGRIRGGLVEGQRPIAFNTKASDGRFHIYTARPDGTDRQQLGVGSASFPQRTTGSPVWSPSGRFMAFVAEKPDHPGNSVPATPGWGSYSDLWVATADGSRAWQLTDVPTDEEIMARSFRNSRPTADCSHGPSARAPADAASGSFRRLLGDQGRQFQRRARRHTVVVRHSYCLAPGRCVQRIRRILRGFGVVRIHQ